MPSEEEISAIVHTRMCEARAAVHFAQPFFGTVLLDLGLEEAEWCKTFATDGDAIYYNRDWALNLSLPQIAFVIMHELLHVIFRHIGRRFPGMDHHLMNLAQDYIINFIIVEQLAKVRAATRLVMPPLGCLDRRFTDRMTPEEVYDLLALNPDEHKSKTTLDEHLQVDEDQPDQGEQVDLSGSEGKPGLSPEKIEENERRLRDKLLAAAMQEQKNGMGRVPECIAHLIDDLIDPVLPWKKMLDTFMRSQMKGRRTFARPSRRTLSLYGATGNYTALAARDRAKTIRLHVFNDCSASMQKDQLIELHSEVVGISQIWSDADITIGSFDDHVYNVRHYTRKTLDEVAAYPFPERGGGTNLPSVFDYLKANDIVPERLVVFTDGQVFDRWGDPDYCPTLWIIHSDRRHAIKPPYGEVAYYDAIQGSFN